MEQLADVLSYGADKKRLRDKAASFRAEADAFDARDRLEKRAEDHAERQQRPDSSPSGFTG